MTRIRDLGEPAFVRALTAALETDDRVVVGPGDDAAAIRWTGPGDLVLVTTDPVLVDVHFRRGDPPEAIGHKALGRNLSDIAAMGGEPVCAVVGLVVDGDVDLGIVEAVYRGMARLARSFAVRIVGGDVACRRDAFDLSVTVLGSVERDRVIRRAGARPGDGIYVTGDLGGSLRGRHLSFVPRVREGRFVATGGYATAMIDLSDGLATDLRHLCAASGVDAIVDADAVPVAPAAEAAARDDDRSALDHALGDGEDFELLLTVDPAREPELVAAWPTACPDVSLTRVGEIAGTAADDRAPRIDIRGSDGTVHPMSGTGYDHFAG